MGGLVLHLIQPGKAVLQNMQVLGMDVVKVYPSMQDKQEEEDEQE